MVVDTHRRQQQHQIGLFQLSGAGFRAGRKRGGIGGRDTGALCRTEVAFGQAQQVVLVHRAGGADHKGFRRVERGTPRAQSLGRGGTDGFGRAQNGATQRLAGKGRLLRQFEDQIVGGVGGFGDLLADDLLFAFEVALVHDRVQHEVAEHGGPEVEAGFQGTNLETGPLIAGGCVDVATLGLDHLDDFARRTGAGTLEHHVFQQVRPA